MPAQRNPPSDKIARMKLTTPAAVLIGLLGVGTMLSVVVYAALRSARRGETASVADPTARPSSAAVPPSAPVVGPVAADTNAVRSEVARALEAQRSALLASCWEPSVRKSAQPARVDFLINLTFDASGKQIMRSLTEGTAASKSASNLRALTAQPPAAAAASRSDVSMCLALTLASISISPPGTSVYVEAPFTLP
jgi:hypothetical protein